MVLNEKEYAELVKDLNLIAREDATEQVKTLELKYWKSVKETTFFQYLVKSNDLDKVLWLLSAIIETKQDLKKMLPADKFYGNLQKDIKDWKQELFCFWKDYDSNKNYSDFSDEMRKSKWTILGYGTILYNTFIEKIYTFF